MTRRLSPSLARLLWLAAVLGTASCSGSSHNQPRQSGLPSEKPWPRLHRLIDAFDAARFTGDTGSRQTLARDLAGTQTLGHGPAATNQVIEQLQIEADALLARDRLHAGAITARTLLEYDRNPPASRDQVWQRMVELKAIAQSDHPLAANARLRLFGYCRRALDDAARASRRDAAAALPHCLYPLYNSDPAPYFAEQPSDRPPPPDPAVLIERAKELLEGGEWGRLAVVRDHLAAELDQFARTHLAALPALPPLDPGATATVASAPYYDWAPIITVTDEAIEPNVDALRVAVQSDGRRQVAVRLGPGNAGQLTRAAELAVAAGAAELQILVAAEQSLTVPPGDYWSERASGETVTRVGYLPVSLAGSGAPIHADAERTAESAGGKRTVGLHLHVSGDNVRLLAPAGIIAEAGGQDAEALTKHLVAMRAAFPDERELAVVVDSGAPIEQALAVLAAAYQADGQPLYVLRLADKAPKAAPGNKLARRVALRARAQVAVEPVESSELQARAPAARACYLGVLDRKPRADGTVHLQRTAGGIQTRGPRELVDCAKRAVADAMNAAGVDSVSVRFSSDEP